jgi:hypothetical protein
MREKSLIFELVCSAMNYLYQILIAKLADRGLCTASVY